jgi:hypothetical protein
MMLRSCAQAAGLAGLAVGAYLAVAATLHQPPQGALIVGLVLLAVGIAALWALVRWLSPLHGLFGEPDQEMALVRVLERELARALRHQAPLVIVAVRGRGRLSPRAVRAQLRASDIVLRGRGAHLVVLMTETGLDQAHLVMERMVQSLPIHAVAMTDEQAVKAGVGVADSDGVAITGFGARYQARRQTAHGPSVALLRGLQLGIFRARARVRRAQPAPIVIIGPGEMRAANQISSARPLDDLTERVA